MGAWASEIRRKVDVSLQFRTYSRIFLTNGTHRSRIYIDCLVFRSVEEVEKIDVEEEERKVFSIWLRENEERQRMALLERFRDDNLSDGGVRELQELGEEMDGNDWSR